MIFDLPKPSYAFNYEGWYKIKGKKSFGFARQKIHYFFKSKKSICGRVHDPAIELIKCDNIEYKKCGACLKQLQRYNDLNNIPSDEE